MTVRYETIQEQGARVAQALGCDEGALAAAFARAHTESIGRWRTDLTAEQVADVEAEAGGDLRDLGYV